MARTYTKTPFKADKVITPQDFNKEMSGIAQQMNRSLDSHNVPALGMTRATLVDRTSTNQGAFYDKSSGVFSDYYSGFDSGIDEFTPIYGVNLHSNTLSSDWNRLDIVDTAELAFGPLKDSVIQGSVVVDWERTRGFDTFGIHAGDEDFWIQFGVFFDGALIQSSGKLFPGRDTLCLPFFTPTNGGAHVLDLRYKFSTGPLPTGSTTFNQTFYIFTCGFKVVSMFG